MFLSQILSPIQCYIIPLSDQQKEYAVQVNKKLKESGIRTYLDESSESVSKGLEKLEIFEKLREKYNN